MVLLYMHDCRAWNSVQNTRMLLSLFVCVALCATRHYSESLKIAMTSLATANTSPLAHECVSGARCALSLVLRAAHGRSYYMYHVPTEMEHTICSVWRETEREKKREAGFVGERDKGRE